LGHFLFLPAVLLGLLCACGGGGGGGVPIFEQSNVHFSGCPTTPVAAPTTCSAVATIRNQGATGTSRQVFYYSLHTGGQTQQATCTPDVPTVQAGASADLTCQLTVPAGAVPADLVLSGR
jgi:hypothetical protein